MQIQRAVYISFSMMKRIFDDAPDEFTQEQPAQKRKRMSRFEGGATSDPVGNGMPSSQNIQELLASTKKQIEERKKQTQALLAQQKLPPTAGLLPTPSAPPLAAPPLPTPAVPAVNKYSEAEHVMSTAMSEAVEKARKAAEVRVTLATDAPPTLIQPLHVPGRKIRIFPTSTCVQGACLHAKSTITCLE